MLPGPASFGRGIRELGANTHQIASHRLKHGASGLDRDMQAVLAQATGKRDYFRRDHGLAAGDHDVPRGIARNLGQNFIQRAVVAFGFPGRVGRVAPTAAEITAARAHEDRWNTGERSFALNRIENFGDFHLTPSQADP